MNKVLVKSILLATLLLSHTPSVHARPWSTDDKCAISIVAAIGGIVTGYALYSWATDWYQTYKENKIPLHISLEEVHDLLEKPLVKIAQKIDLNADTITRFAQLEEADEMYYYYFSGTKRLEHPEVIDTKESIKKKIDNLKRRKEKNEEVFAARRNLESALELIKSFEQLKEYRKTILSAATEAQNLVSDSLIKESYLILKASPLQQFTCITNTIINSHLTHAARAARNSNFPAYPFINYRKELLTLASRIQETICVLINGDYSVQNTYHPDKFQVTIEALRKTAALIELHPTYIAELNLKQQEDARRQEEEYRQEMARVARRQMEQAAQHQREIERLARQQARATQELADAQRMQAVAHMAAALNPQPIVIEIQNNTHHRN